jgi:hypothetical protein
MFVFTDQAMLGLFRPDEKHVSPTILTAGALGFFDVLGCMLKFSLESACLPFLEHDISTMIWILECYYLD